MKFKFGDNLDVTINSRITKEAKEKLRTIAEREGVSVGEVVRVFIDSGIVDYDKETSHK